MVDCSHGNSQKNHKNQPKVAAAVADQIAAGKECIVGVMIESHLCEGNQKLEPGLTEVSTLKRGVSVTDACIDFDTTVSVLERLAAAVRERRSKK